MTNSSNKGRSFLDVFFIAVISWLFLSIVIWYLETYSEVPVEVITSFEFIVHVILTNWFPLLTFNILDVQLPVFFGLIIVTVLITVSGVKITSKLKQT